MSQSIQESLAHMVTATGPGEPCCLHLSCFLTGQILIIGRSLSSRVRPTKQLLQTMRPLPEMQRVQTSAQLPTWDQDKAEEPVESTMICRLRGENLYFHFCWCKQKLRWHYLCLIYTGNYDDRIFAFYWNQPEKILNSFSFISVRHKFIRVIVWNSHSH